jgi:hypothetical protein
MSSLTFAGPVGKPRSLGGRFASPDSPAAITTVLLPSWTIGYRVGPNGRIYANREHALAFAGTRARKAVAR